MISPRKDGSDAKQTINLTPRAVKRLQEMMQQSGNPNLALRLKADAGGPGGMNYNMGLTDKREEGDVVFDFNGEGAMDGDGKVKELLENNEVGSTSDKEPESTTSASSTSSAYAPALQPYLGSNSSSTPRLAGQGQPPPFIQRRPPPTAFWDPNLDDMEISFLRIVSRTNTPIATPEDTQLDCVDRQLDMLSRHGTTMQVHRGTWRGRKVAFKYIRRGWFPEGSDAGTGDRREPTRAYRQDMYDLNFELQIMSKTTLRSHPNITQLLAVCFSALTPTPEQSTSAFAEPGLIVELAHEQFPDLASFFDLNTNPERPARLPYNTAASLIADIADGVQVLHDHDLVHADLKPGNILLFPNSASRCGLTAKIADFGFVGMTTYTHDGRRAPLPDARPRGGTPEWNAPECLKNSDPFDPRKSYTLNHPQYKPTRDIYSFGLLATYIALDGQSPRRYVDNHAYIKLQDKMEDAAVTKIEQYYEEDEASQGMSLKSAAIAIARATLRLDPQARAPSIRSLNIRNLLFNDLTSPTRWPTEMFILNFNLFPQSAHEFRHSGLYDAYWNSPPSFRERVYASFRKLADGPSGLMLGQFVHPDIWALLEQSGE